MPSRPEVLTEAFRSILTRRKKQPPKDPLLSPSLPGHRVEWREDPQWRAATPAERERRCRRPGCERAPVAALLRRGVYGRTTAWLYCSWHLYGRRWRGGRVEGPRLIAEPAA